jgi:hypothetical protein
MFRFLLWKPGWWILHIVALVGVAYLGHMMR